ncbi:MAG: class I SAM-dependent methyltransferase [Pseudomonadota bacterium]|nr:MAG: class I SAM-dependent methyltransferase [Pseudomonadota bacterium]
MAQTKSRARVAEQPIANPAGVAVLIDAQTPDLAARAQTLAMRLHLPLVTDTSSAEADLILACTAERLELRDARDPRVGPVYVDFTQPRRMISRRDPLVRALGKHTRTVVDVTAGLGQDAYRLASLGFEVIAIERNPIVAALLEDGLRRTVETAGLRLLCGDARALLRAMEPAPDAVLIDPMFPTKRRRSAAVRKEMRLLRALVGDDPDATELFGLCRTCARERVVVKRPDHAPPLAGNPSHSYAGKLVRYDVYPTAKR